MTTADALDPRGRLDPAAVEVLLDRAGRDADESGLPSCQMALARNGRLLLQAAFGDATTESRYPVFSITKALTAGAAWLAIGDGKVDPTTRVVDLVPEFGTNGKAAVTLEHLLTHTAGFPRAPMRPLEGADRAARVARFATWRLDWQPGTQTEYHPSSADWVVAEVVERATGSSLGEVIATRICGPLGLSGLQLGAVDGALDVAVIGSMSEETRVALDRVGAAATLAETGPEHLLRFNDPQVRAAGVPGAGAIGTAADVARYFQALLRDPVGIWEPEVLQDATGFIRNRMVDPWVRVPANRTLGLRVAGDDGNAVLRGFGHGVGPRSFGAAGVGGQVAWADPDSGLSFCYLTNGLDADPVRSFRRQASLSELAARCVAG
ncbi:MAG: serine hydrolase domain-containing protein [Actinomycetota bacterium]